jgi:hypothetical protein
MAKSGTQEADGCSEVVENPPPRCIAIAAEGIETGEDFAKVMSAMMSDLLEGRITPQVGNATCNAGGKLLKIVELQYKYGDTSGGKPRKRLKLTGGNGADSEEE